MPVLPEALALLSWRRRLDECDEELEGVCALQPAWKSTNMLGAVYRIVEGEPTHIPPELYSLELRSLIDAMLTKDRHARPSLADVDHLPIVRRWRQRSASRRRWPRE